MSRTLPAALLIAVPLVSAASDAGVREFLRLTEQYETGGDCTARPATSSAIGCYQMTRRALKDVGLKDDAGDWLPNPWGITSDEEFQTHRAANDYAMKQYARLNWGWLNCDTKSALCAGTYDIEIGPASLLTGAHFLGAGGMNDFVACGMGAECVSDTAVRANGGNRARIHDRLMRRMEAVAGLDVSELTPADSTRCGGRTSCRERPPADTTTSTGGGGGNEGETPGYVPVLVALTSLSVLGAAGFLLARLLGGSTSEGSDRHVPGHDAPPPAPPAPPAGIVGTLHPIDGSPPIPLPVSRMTSRQGFVIGRDVELCDLQIRDPGVSRRHLRLRAASGRIVAEDLNSLAGSRVSGVALTPFAPHPIAPGETLGIAGLAYELRLSTPGRRRPRDR